MIEALAPVAGRRVVVGLSGGVDSAVAALLLKQAGADVHALHMTNWEDDDGYCTAAADLQDARSICAQLDIPLHHVNFASEYRQRVFSYFLDEYRAGRTPNPDVLCNREIKFGELRRYAVRLGGDLLATGHYARTAELDGETVLLKGSDPNKDQSYFLHAVPAEALRQTVFPLGPLAKGQVRKIAHEYGLTVHDKKDSTGICFIGERPFREFLANFVDATPGPIQTPEGEVVGEHTGLPFYTLGQRQGLGIGGLASAGEAPWYVVAKNARDNALIVDQGDTSLLDSDMLAASGVTWIGRPPAIPGQGYASTCKVRYRQPDQTCTIFDVGEGQVEVSFNETQRAVAPGQFAVFYDGDRCLGGGAIDRAWQHEPAAAATGGAAKS